jgi:hypothetical protein
MSMSSSAKRSTKGAAAHKTGAGGSGSAPSIAAPAAPATLENSSPVSIQTASTPAGAETGPLNRDAAAGAGSAEAVPASDESAAIVLAPEPDRALARPPTTDHDSKHVDQPAPIASDPSKPPAQLVSAPSEGAGAGSAASSSSDAVPNDSAASGAAEPAPSVLSATRPQSQLRPLLASRHQTVRVPYGCSAARNLTVWILQTTFLPMLHRPQSN